MTMADLPMLFEWMHEPGVSRWWGAPPADLAEIERKYSPRVFGTEPVACLIAESAGRPFAFLQWYWLVDYPTHPASALVEGDWAGVDLLIGQACDRGRGLGSQLLRVWLAEVFPAHPNLTGVAVDPSSANQRAIAAYRQAGFEDRGIGTDPESGGPCRIMLRRREHPGD